MSWHCGYCGGVEFCNATITVYDIRGMVPKHFVCCLRCFAKSLPTGDLQEELLDIDDELTEEREKKEIRENVIENVALDFFRKSPHNSIVDWIMCDDDSHICNDPKELKKLDKKYEE